MFNLYLHLLLETFKEELGQIRAGAHVGCHVNC
jgi:hypothetical protein